MSTKKKPEYAPAIRMEFRTPGERRAFARIQVAARKYKLKPTTWCRRAVLLRLAEEDRGENAERLRLEMTGPEQLDMIQQIGKRKRKVKRAG